MKKFNSFYGIEWFFFVLITFGLLFYGCLTGYFLKGLWLEHTILAMTISGVIGGIISLIGLANTYPTLTHPLGPLLIYPTFFVIGLVLFLPHETIKLAMPIKILGCWLIAFIVPLLLSGIYAIFYFKREKYYGDSSEI
ncbi:MAG: hypothetical protein PHE24_00570 [Patescibacteria group bacterium]|nr:hypothetical protein [Patescibacteria group bacterium]